MISLTLLSAVFSVLFVMIFYPLLAFRFIIQKYIPFITIHTAITTASCNSQIFRISSGYILAVMVFRINNMVEMIRIIVGTIQYMYHSLLFIFFRSFRSIPMDTRNFSRSAFSFFSISFMAYSMIQFNMLNVMIIYTQIIDLTALSVFISVIAVFDK